MHLVYCQKFYKIIVSNFSWILCTDVPREIIDNRYAKFQGVNKVHYGLDENGEFFKCFLKYLPVIKIYVYHYYYYYSYYYYYY